MIKLLKTTFMVFMALVMSVYASNNEEMNFMKMPIEKTQKSTVPGRSTIEITPLQRQLIDIRTAPVIFGNAIMAIRTVGIVAYDQTRIENVNFKISGWIEKLYVDKPGQFVTRGQPLMDLYSPALYSAQQEYLIALNYFQKLKSSLNSKEAGVSYAGWQRNLEEADSLRNSSYKRLKLWDISDGEIDSLEKSQKPTDTMQLKSPITGYVVDKKVYPGQMIQEGMTLYHIADLSTVWIDADFYEYELPLIQIGQKVAIGLIAHPEKKFEGVLVDFIYPYLENKTRTNIVRLVIENENELLKPNMYANIELKIDLGKQILVPAEAVFNTGLEQYVFVQEGEGIFVPQAIKLGPRADGYFVIRDGLKEGQKVVIEGNFLIDSESQLNTVRESGMKGMQGM